MADSGNQELKLAAAALTAAVSPPLGFLLAAGAAARSEKLRQAARRGAILGIAGGMRVGEAISSNAKRDAQAPASENGPAPSAASAERPG